jgi:hypothetical protein
LFFAGQNHVHIQVIASPTEAELINTTPTPVQNQAQGTIDLQAPQASPEAVANEPQQSAGA